MTTNDYTIKQTAWVEDDMGFYGEGNVITFNPDDLTEFQWNILANIDGIDRFGYVQACLDNNVVGYYARLEESVKEAQKRGEDE